MIAYYTTADLDFGPRRLHGNAPIRIEALSADAL